MRRPPESRRSDCFGWTGQKRAKRWEPPQLATAEGRRHEGDSEIHATTHRSQRTRLPHIAPHDEPTTPKKRAGTAKSCLGAVETSLANSMGLGQGTA